MNSKGIAVLLLILALSAPYTALASRTLLGGNAAYAASDANAGPGNADSTSFTATEGNGQAHADGYASNGKQKAATESNSASYGKGSAAADLAQANDSKKYGASASNSAYVKGKAHADGAAGAGKYAKYVGP